MALLPTLVGLNRPDHRPAITPYLAKLSTLNRPGECAMPAVNMLDAKTNLSRLVESLEQGSEREFIIARHGRPGARPPGWCPWETPTPITSAWVSPKANSVWISVASLWSITIKHSLGRGGMPIAGAQTKAWFEASGCRLLNIEAIHVLGMAALPLHHNDPFDRLLVAQALAAPLRLITLNAQIARYSDTITAI